jgi:hypothetical protein
LHFDVANTNIVSNFKKERFGGEEISITPQTKPIINRVTDTYACTVSVLSTLADCGWPTGLRGGDIYTNL